jgi:Fe2+ or Zn2+ uptake regulation protein
MNTQLDLFEGLVLTTEQQEQIDSFVKNEAKRAVVSQENVNRTMLLLDEAGFVQGVDYNSNYEVYEVTKKREFGYSYNNTNFEHEVTYMNAVGNVYLITDTIKEGKIVKYNAPVSREGNKLMCTSITEQYRYYKPSSLLTKLKENRKSKITELNRQNKEQVCLDYTVAKYQKLYPEATVKAGTDYHSGYRRGYESFPIVVIKFKSGSSVTFKLGYGYELDQERLHKSYDAQLETVEQTLERFNNQKAK